MIDWRNGIRTGGGRLVGGSECREETRQITVIHIAGSNPVSITCLTHEKSMADRTSAGLFGKIFELLAKNPTEENKNIALEIWPLQGDYDFSEYQMDADDSLIKLGLAKHGIDPRYPEDGETLIYADENGKFNL